MRRVISIVFVVAFGCSSGAANPPDDLATTADLALVCGAPGNPGNSVGVGRACGMGADCPAAPQASLCVPLIGEGRSFCTKLCASAADTQCGEGARCACAGGGCTCMPAECER
jgi:hypothetical protein